MAIFYYYFVVKKRMYVFDIILRLNSKVHSPFPLSYPFPPFWPVFVALGRIILCNFSGREDLDQHPSGPFHNFRASGSGYRQMLWSSGTSCDGFCGSKITKGSVGQIFFLRVPRFLRIPSFRLSFSSFREQNSIYYHINQTITLETELLTSMSV